MYIFDLNMFLVEDGTLRPELTPEGREMAGFLIMLVDTATREILPGNQQQELTCVEKSCNGRIVMQVEPINKFIMWYCHTCGREGVLQGWSNSRWDHIGGF